MKTPEEQTPLPKAGPLPISIEEYLQRVQRRKEEESIRRATNNGLKIKRPRAGRKVRERQRKGELHRLIVSTLDDNEKKKFLKELQEINKNNK